MAGMRYQPQGAIRIRRAHPLARGLVVVVHPKYPGVNLVDGLPLQDAYGTGTSWYSMANAAGLALANNGSRNYRIMGPSIATQSGYTTAAVLIPRANVTDGADMVQLASSGWNGGGIVMGDGSNPRFALPVNADTGFKRIAGASNYELHVPQSVLTTCDSVSQRVAINGALVASAAYAPGNFLNNGRQLILFSPSYDRDVVELNLLLVWNRPFSADEAKALSANLWQMFEDGDDDDKSSWATSVSYALSAAAGAFGLAAQGALLRAARRLPAAAGSLVAGGALAALLVARRATWQPGEFNVGAGAVQVRAARRLAAVAGSAGLAATPVSMTASRKLPAAVGALAAVGQAGSLRAARHLTGTTGVLSLVGQPISMVYSPAELPQGYMLAATSGAFGLAGADAALHAHRRLASAPVAMTLTAAAIRVVSGRKLATAPAGFVLQTASVTLRPSRRVPAESAVFGLKVLGAQLLYSGKIDYASAPDGHGYTPQRHYNESRPAATSSPRPAAIQRNYR